MSEKGDPPLVDEEQAAAESRRVRRLTEKGEERHEQKKNELHEEVEGAWSKVEQMVMDYDKHQGDIRALKTLGEELKPIFRRFTDQSDHLLNFLCRENTKEDIEEAARHREYYQRCKSIVDRVFQNIRQKRLELVETLSQSDRSSAMSNKRLLAEISQSKLHYKQKEAEIRRKQAIIKEQFDKTLAATERQKTELEVDLDIIKLESENAVAQTEMKALADDLEERSVTDRVEFTREYVQKLDIRGAFDERTQSSSSQPGILQRPKADDKLVEKECEKSKVNTDAKNDSVLNPHAAVFNSGVNAMTELSQFLMKKDLQLSRFSNFNDKAEAYAAWKASFCSIAAQLNLTPFEEIDLLVKYLGPESSKFASSIKVSNTHDPAKGLESIWARLEERYGRPEMVEAALKKKLHNFPKLNRDMTKLYDLLDILREIESTKANPQYATLLAYFDSSSGVTPVVNKLPPGIQQKWVSHAARYKKEKCVPYPPFTFFVSFIRDISETKNDPAFMFEPFSYQETRTRDSRHDSRHNVFSRKQEVNPAGQVNHVVQQTEHEYLKRCPLHHAEHSLNSCRGFRVKPIEERKKILRENNVCFRCCDSAKHVSRNCKAVPKCIHCGRGHASAMHIDTQQFQTRNADGGEPLSKREEVSSKCTTLCGEKFIGKSCSKTVLVDVYSYGHPEKAERVYAIIDDQSNRTLGSQELFNKLQIQGETTQYTLSSCSGRVTSQGRIAHALCVRTVTGDTEIRLPSVIECDDIPNEVSEIPTPEVAKAYEHLQYLAKEIPELDPSCKIQLLIGRDLPEAHHVLEQVVGQPGMPFAQKLMLGWVIVGEICLGRVHPPDVVSVNKTTIMPNGRGTIFEPCQYSLNVKENEIKMNPLSSETAKSDFRGDAVFTKTAEDDKVGLSVEDKQFLLLMKEEMTRDEEGFWTAPLPFKKDIQGIPNNRAQALRRAQLLDVNLKKNPVKKAHFITFMAKVLESGAAEVAPTDSSGNGYYLPLFGIYHPRKPDQLRGVFDSSAVYQGVSLNSLLMSGPDLINSLVGVLLRFRKDAYAVTGDVEQMFYRFRVHPDHRNFLRFFWYKNNNPDEELIEFRMRVHVFGNCASPAVATYGLNKAVENADNDIKDFVKRNFYVDDALTSKPEVQEAVDLMKRTQDALKDGGNIRLHKIASNSLEVMKAFPSDDLGGDLKSLDLSQDTLPVQRSLGLSWNLKDDVFAFQILLEEKPFTRRGLLSMVNSIFDPLGFIAPITISGKILLREATPPGVDWDDPLSADHQKKWSEWRESLQNLQDVTIRRMFTTMSVSSSAKSAIYVFSDASEKAIAAVAYIKLWDKDGKTSVGFLLGKAKVAPSTGHTIPRLELCGAVLATEIAEIISAQLDVPLGSMTFFTDSKVVLGYICNQTRRFFTYVSNRVEKIVKVASSSQWRYVSTERNPADCATRCSTGVNNLKGTIWLPGPKWLQDFDNENNGKDTFPLVSPDDDKELRPDVNVHKTSAKMTCYLGCERFSRFSSWNSLVRAITLLKSVARSKEKHVDQDCHRVKTDTDLKATETIILKAVQEECFSEEISRITDKKSLQKNSRVAALSPILDDHGILRVGGRLDRIIDQMPIEEIKPIILPKNHHVSMLLIQHYHESVKHQGRVLTEGALRSAGFWVIGAKRIISSYIHKCVSCRRLRGRLEQQKMADLPEDRLTPGPPFTSVGIDAFGPWQVLTRKTRGAANSKRWAILFTCLTSRAVHIELVEEMSSSSFINALRRFLSIRGPVKLFRSDRGTNFIGAVDDLGIDAIKVEDGPVKQFLHKSGITWMFNVPHSSHMGGVWERMIGLTRKVLDSILYEARHRPLTHEALSTFMAEVTAILNNRPLAPISTDPTSAMVLRPSMLLTGKVDILPAVSDNLTEKDALRSQWKRVQVLADTFWRLWRRDYLHLLQVRKKWCVDYPNLKTGDIVLLRDSQEHRNQWPLGFVDRAFQSEDGKVRKVEVRVYKDHKTVSYLRPVNEVVLLIA